MSRSAVVALVVGLVLVAALGVVAGMYWPVLAKQSRFGVALVLGGTLYAALLAAVCIRRIVDPKLTIPILAWIVIIGFWIMSLFGKKTDDDNTVSSSSSSGFSPGKPMGRGWAILMSLLALGLYGGGIAFAVYLTRQPAREAVAATHKPAVEAVASTPERSTTTPPADIMAAPDLAAAIAFAKPNLSDTRDGAAQLTRWAVAKMKLADVAVAKNETTLELVEKDPKPTIGKRLCVSGTLARIEKQDLGGSAVHIARLVTKQNDNVELIAVGSTGTLVKRKSARFCGVVTGLLGPGKPATIAVGMFDIPENKR